MLKWMIAHKTPLIALILLLPHLVLPATDRIPDIVYYQGDLYHLSSSFPLDSFLSRYKLFPKHSDAPMMVTKRGQMDGTNNPNFHVASWVVQNDRLYLAGIEGYVYPSFNAWYLESIEKNVENARNDAERQQLMDELQSLRDKGVKSEAVNAIDYFFPDRAQNALIFAQWYSGQLLLIKQRLTPYSSSPGSRIELILSKGKIVSTRRL